MYIDIFRRHRDAVSRKYPEKCRTKSWCVPRDSAPAHHSVLLKDLLGKNNVTTLENPSYSPDLAAANLYFWFLPYLCVAITNIYYDRHDGHNRY